MKLGIRDLKAKSKRDFVLKVCAGGGTPKKPLGITGLLEFSVAITGLTDPIRDPLTSMNELLGITGIHDIHK